ncbi:hypothetical protein BST63_27435 [Bradyrhizobium canariense]|uniref:Uncharacterized protein n=1 Tax=Bradyrhizobium canariense TaxID=255045 RepID=A0ABX3WX36_9BRAD|nr:hypothetical protein BSR47_35805 [Bradyrhizobium canariense]OSJ24271.1 hypothetical protein BST63_27435 [Bradyrhizobium canariense]
MFAADHRRSISFTAGPHVGQILFGGHLRVIDDEKKIRFRLPRTGPPPGMASAIALMPASDPPTGEA